MFAPYQISPPRSTAATSATPRAVRSIPLASLGTWLRTWATWGLLVSGAASCSVTADCKNQACVCAEGASCDFDCEAPPCHIECRRNSDCSGACANGSCTCQTDSHCDFACDAPPCHVDCESNTDCSGTCANGTCSCSSGSDCDFTCEAGPCRVECGAGARCSGECSNQECLCGVDGRCDFTCKDHNCKTSCPSGAQCLLRCGSGSAGSPGCQFDSCSGSVTECANGTLACNRGCP